jgi:hypothetical protein
MIASAKHDRGATLALQERNVPQTEKPDIHKLTAGYLLTSFLPQSLQFGIRGLTLVASALGLCPHFSVEDYYFPVDNVQQPEMFANAELYAPESFRDT